MGNAHTTGNETYYYGGKAMTPEEYKMPTGFHSVSIGVNHRVVIGRGKSMTPEEIKMLKQLIEIRDQILSIVNKNEFGEAIDKGAKLVVRQLLERYKTTEEEILEHTTE